MRTNQLGGPMDKGMVEQLLDVARGVVAGGAIGGNGHGNISLKVPGAPELYHTGGYSLRDHPASSVVRLGMDGSLLEGTLPPIQRAVVQMHAMAYADPVVTCVVHTHAPFATAFAVAHRRIEPWVEGMAMFGLADGVPLAAYGPRGSEASLEHIRAALLPGTPAVLPAGMRAAALQRHMTLVAEGSASAVD